MKFITPEYARHGKPTITMARTLPPRQLRRIVLQETVMKWETPKATDLRFGFEITMYISTR